jgi:opacity protein-like surface antigen
LPRPIPRLATGAALLAALHLGACVSLPVHNATLLGGMRFLDSETWDPVDTQPTVGIELDTYKPGDGIGAELGFLYSWEGGSAQIPNLGTAEIDTVNYELYMGARKTFPIRNEPFYPYIGAGLSWIANEYDATLIDGQASSSDDAFGVYFRAGVYWNFASNWNLGLDVRRRFGGEVDVLGVDAGLDYLTTLATVGFSF